MEILFTEHYPIQWLWKGEYLTINSLWHSDAIWRLRSRSTLVHVMACCLTTASHYLNQCWLIISKVQWHSYDSCFTGDTSAIDHYNQLENYSSRIQFESPWGQWVKCFHNSLHTEFLLTLYDLNSFEITFCMIAWYWCNACILNPLWKKTKSDIFNVMNKQKLLWLGYENLKFCIFSQIFNFVP